MTRKRATRKRATRKRATGLRDQVMQHLPRARGRYLLMEQRGFSYLLFLADGAKGFTKNMAKYTGDSHLNGRQN